MSARFSWWKFIANHSMQQIWGWEGMEVPPFRTGIRLTTNPVDCPESVQNPATWREAICVETLFFWASSEAPLDLFLFCSSPALMESVDRVPAVCGSPLQKENTVWSCITFPCLVSLGWVHPFILSLASVYPFLPLPLPSFSMHSRGREGSAAEATEHLFYEGKVGSMCRGSPPREPEEGMDTTGSCPGVVW